MSPLLLTLTLLMTSLYLMVPAASIGHAQNTKRIKRQSGEGIFYIFSLQKISKGEFNYDGL